MFNFEPVTTSNVISILQIAVVLFGFIFSWRSLEATRANIKIASQSLDETRKNIAIGTNSLSTASKSLTLATSNAQAQLYNQMVIQGRDLQYKFIDLYLDGETEEDRKKRQDQYTGTVLSYYAACYGLRSILDLPPSITKLLDDEVKQSMRAEPIRKKWDQISDNFSKEFIEYVGRLKGV